MYPTTFRILNINQVTTDVTVQLYNYYEFGNLFLASLIPEYYQYFYPQAPLPVSNSTTVERFISRVGNGYAVADFDFYQAAQFS